MSRFLDSGINIDTRYWKLLSINTVLAGKTEGYVTDEAYKKFELEIESTRKNTLVVMHHPPFLWKAFGMIQSHSQIQSDF